MMHNKFVRYKNGWRTDRPYLVKSPAMFMMDHLRKFYPTAKISMIDDYLQPIETAISNLYWFVVIEFTSPADEAHFMLKMSE
jgi:hypothetical protein